MVYIYIYIYKKYGGYLLRFISGKDLLRSIIEKDLLRSIIEKDLLRSINLHATLDSQLMKYLAQKAPAGRLSGSNYMII